MRFGAITQHLHIADMLAVLVHQWGRHIDGQYASPVFANHPMLNRRSAFVVSLRQIQCQPAGADIYVGEQDRSALSNHFVP